MLLLLMLAYVVSGFTPVIYSDKPSTKCGQSSPMNDELLMDTIQQVHHQLGPPGCNPPRNRSCQEILYCFPSASSDYYQIHAANGSLVPVYCNMEGTNCGNTTGWTRVAYLNMTQPGATCPQPLVPMFLKGRMLCYKPNGVGCYGTMYSTLGLSYSQMCGQVKGYHYGAPDAFYSFIHFDQTTINSYYVDGLSITYGKTSARKHIWTYAAGALQRTTSDGDCPCNNGSNIQPPPFVGNDYYCESATNTITESGILYDQDPLWDRQQCTNIEGPCCTHPNMPWFIKTLDQSTTEDIELRSCSNLASNEHTPIEIFEMYVR